MALPVGRKVLLDTNVIIDYLRAELHRNWVFGGHPNIIRFTSAVVLMELHLGANTPARQRAVARIETAFQQRILVPTAQIYTQAAQLFRALYGDVPSRSDRLAPVNDLLIALTGRDIGATVVTSNITEFTRIAEKVPGLRVLTPTEAL